MFFKVIWIIRAISFDANFVARIAGVRILRDGRISIPATAKEHFFKRVVPGLPSDTQADVWSYLVEVATDDDLQLLLAVAPGTWLEPRSDWLRAWLQAQRELGGFLNLGPSMDFVTPKRLHQPAVLLLQRRDVAGSDRLYSGVNHDSLRHGAHRSDSDSRLWGSAGLDANNGLMAAGVSTLIFVDGESPISDRTQLRHDGGSGARPLAVGWSASAAGGSRGG